MCSIKGNNKLLFNETASLAIVALFSSNAEMGSLVFVVSGYLFFLLIINSFFSMLISQSTVCLEGWFLYSIPFGFKGYLSAWPKTSASGKAQGAPRDHGDAAHARSLCGRRTSGSELTEDFHKSNG